MKKLNYKKLGAFILVCILIIVGIIIGISKLISNINYKKTYEYKFLELGYSMDEFKILDAELKDSQKDALLKLEYDSEIVKFTSEKYFIFKNLDSYLEYKKENKKKEYTDIVAIVNTESHIDWIDNMKDTDVSKGELMLVNRIYGLKSDYEPSDIITVSSQYALSGVKISESIMDDITNMILAAKEEGYTFVLSDGYRSYKEQEKIFNQYKDSWGIEEADRLVARPGHSEYQTGLSFDIVPYYYVESVDDVKKSKEYLWLRDNAHNYGFIFRFEENKKDLTGFNAYTWRLRYVGEDAASLIKGEGICYEEYYAYFVDKE